MTKLKNITRLIKLILEQDERARNSDSYLYFRVIGVLADQKQIDIHSMPITDYLLSMRDLGFPPFESVRRARQKIQSEFSELSGNNAVRGFRSENERVFREYARVAIE